MTKPDRRHTLAHLSITREFASYLRGEAPVRVNRRDPTHCFCGRRALYRTNRGNEGRCSDHRDVKGGETR
jgi:hypothetical protein